MLTQFVDKYGAIDKEGLRLYGLEAMRHYKEILDVLTTHESASFWKELHNTIGMTEEQEKKDVFRKSEAQVIGLRQFIESYIQNALDSPERFEMFVQTKAADLGGSDDMHDYYWALQIRLDQVMAVIAVLGDILIQMQVWVKNSPEKLLNDPYFLELSKTSIEDRIYFAAEKHFTQRSRT